MAKKIKPEGIVYSTNPDFEFQYFQGDEPDTRSAKEQEFRVWLEKGGRGGKQVSVVKGFVGKAADLEMLGKELKTRCACGGTVKDNEIIIQGDSRDKIIEYLLKKGYRVKKAGG